MRALASLVALSLLLPQACWAETAASPVVALTAAEERVERLTDDMLYREIELERFYTQWRTIGTKEPRWRHLRYFLGQQTGESLTLASQIIGLDDIAHGLRDPSRLSVPQFRNSNYCGLIGSIIEGSSSGIEFASNGALAWKNKRLKRDPETARRNVLARVAQIDSLAKERDAAVKECAGTTGAALYAAEGRVLKTFRDWCLYEFAEIYSDVKSYQASSNVYYAFDVTSNIVYVASYLWSLQALHRLQLGGAAAISGIVGDGIAIQSAPASSLAYNQLYKFWHRRLERQLGEKLYDAEAPAQTAMDEVEACILAPGVRDAPLRAAAAKRLEVFSLWARRYEKFIEKRELDLRRLSRVATQSNITGPLIGGTYLASDIIGTNTFYHLKHNMRAATANTFAAAIATTAASTTSVGYTAGLYIGDMVHHRNLKRQDALPADLIAQRLKTLDDLEILMGVH